MMVKDLTRIASRSVRFQSASVCGVAENRNQHCPAQPRESDDGDKLKPFPAGCVLLLGVGRLVTLKLLIKVGVAAMALILAALPVAACVLPGTAMTSAERECCKKMAEQCGDMGMAKSHPCCKVSATPADFHALKTASSQLHRVSLVLFHALPLTAQTDAYFSLAQWSSRVSCTHSPPGLESLTTTVLRI